jgi:hypothetical protein
MRSVGSAREFFSTPRPTLLEKSRVALKIALEKTRSLAQIQARGSIADRNSDRRRLQRGA